jgi:gas vesicle protein
MAKNSDQRAGGFEAENTGGVLSGLLAEEEHLDRRAMFRLAAWGVVAVGAVVVAVLANQSGMKLRRDETAALDLTRQSQQIQSVAKESQNETRRLASAIDTLNGDRDRLYSRLTSLEQGLESVTGAIAKQNAVAAAPVASSPAATPPAATAPAATPATAPQPVAQGTAPEPAPVIAPVTTVAAAVPEKSASERRSESRKSSQAPAAPVAAATPVPSNAPPATSAMPLMASKSMIGPPDPAAGKLIEPKSIEPETPAKSAAAATPAPTTPAPPTPAATPALATPAPATAATTTPAPVPSAAVTPAPATTPEPAPEVAAAAPAADKPAADKDNKKDVADAAPAAAPQLAVKRTEFGVDVGGANSVSGLRALWRGLLKWRSNAALAGLQPIIVVKEGNNGLGMQLRLVAGPLTDAAAAARICAAMTINDRRCETTVYDGQRLALTAEDTPRTTESIAAKPLAENPSPEKPSDPAAGKPAADTSSSDKSSAKPGNRQGTRRHYSYTKRSAPVVETPAPPPAQTSSLSWFRSRSQ